MKRSAFLFLAVLFAGAGSVAHAQAATQTKPPASKPKDPVVSQRSTAIDPRDSVSIADVQRAADELARTVQAAVKKISEDPKLKIAALNLAKQSVTAAQVIVDQQAITLESIIEGLTREVAAATANIQQNKPKTH